MRLDRKLALIMVLTMMLSIVPAVDGQAAPGKWVRPMFQNELAIWIDSYSEGRYVGHMYTSIDADEFRYVIFDESFKRLAVTKFMTLGGESQGFFDGLMSVRVVTEDDLGSGLFGYMDMQGNEAIPAQYSQVSDFKNGLAVVQKTENGKELTQVINKKGEVQFQKEGFFEGSVLDDYVFLEDDLGEKDYENMDSDVPINNQVGSYYDYKGNRVLPAERKNKYDGNGYWDKFGVRHDIKGFNKEEWDTFVSKYGKLYYSVEYLGRGFFNVKEPMPQVDEPESFDTDTLKMSIVDKENKTIIPMGKYDEIDVGETETSKYFVPYVGAMDKAKPTGLFNDTGKKILNKGSFSGYGYATGNAIFYCKMPNLGWGMKTLDTGKDIFPYSKKYLAYWSPFAKTLLSASEYQKEPPKSLFIYTSVNMDEKADVTSLRATVTKATAILKKTKLAESRRNLTKAISGANRVLKQKNPRWMDVNIIEIELISRAHAAKYGW